MPKKAFAVARDSDGVVRQKYRNTKYKPTELKKLLDKPSLLKDVKQRYLVITATEEELQPVALKCKGCSTLVSPCEPSMTTKQHDAKCKSPPEADDEVEELLDDDDDGADDGEERTGKRRRTQNALTQYMPSAQKQDSVHRDLLRALITGNIVFQFMNNVYLRRAFGRVGVQLKGFMVATDGWKNKHCEQGSSLVNCMVLKPHGGAIFFRVMKSDGTQKKDAKAIAEMHKELLHELEAVAGPDKVSAFIMDNCRVNRAACKQLEDEFPHIVAYGCQVHAMNLLVISNVYSDSSRVRSQLHHFQREEYQGSIKAITPNSPTRWGCIIIIGRDILDTKAALQNMVEDVTWADIASRNADELGAFVLDNHRWQQLKITMKLLQPLMDAMSQLEGDRAMLSQVPTAWSTLVQNARAWVEGLPQAYASLGEGVVEAVEERAQKHHHPALEAAFYLDPLNFEKRDGDEHAHPTFLELSDDQSNDIKVTVARLAKTTVGVVAEELTALDGGRDWSTGMKNAANMMSSRERVQPIKQRQRFWQAAAHIAPHVAEAAQKLMSMHASTAAAERNWSAWSRLYRNALRNRLKVDQAEKMVYIKANLQVKETDDAVQLQMDTVMDD